MTIATILIVDDIAENRDMLSRRLERRGYMTEQAADGQSALEAISAQSVDLVLLDIMLPDMSGLDVLRQIRETSSRRALPVIMVSAKNESFDVVEALNLGANDYVTKPVDFAVTMARIDTHLQVRDTVEETYDKSGAA